MLNITTNSIKSYSAVFIFLCVFVFLMMFNIKFAEADVATCLAQEQELRKTCEDLRGQGPDAEYNIDCSEQAFASALCACLYNIDSCGDTATTDELSEKIGRAIELEFQYMGMTISEREQVEKWGYKYDEIKYLSNFMLPLDNIKWIRGANFIGVPKNDPNYHSGIDLYGNVGDKIYAMNDGIVKYVDYDKKNGYRIIIDHGNGITISYSHMNIKGINIKVGDPVHAGTEIGELGNTGASSGPHLHLEGKYGDGLQEPTIFLGAIEVGSKDAKLQEFITSGFNTPSENFSDEYLTGIGQNVLNLNFNYPQEFASLPEDEQKKVALEAMTQYAKITDSTTNPDVALARAIDNVLAVNAADAYALTKLVSEGGSQNLYEDFGDIYLGKDFFEGITDSNTRNANKSYNIDHKLGSKSLVLEDSNKHNEDAEKSDQDEVADLVALYSERKPFYEVSGSPETSVVIKTENVNNENSKSDAQETTNATISVYKEGNLRVIVYDDGSKNAPYQFAATENLSLSNQEVGGFENNKGAIKSGKQITVEGTTLYPLTEKGYSIISYIHNEYQTNIFSESK